MNKASELQKLKEEILQNDSLPLKKEAKQLVFGVGNPAAEFLYLGEAPGYWEDQKGEPFVGNAGKLLDKMLAKVSLSRKDVFITNVVMFRPPENRDPLPQELNAFDPYIDKIIQIIEPKLIITLGRFSMAKFLKDVKITQVHGKLYKKEIGSHKVFVIPMFHPAAALRNPGIMKMFEEDFLRLPKAIEKIKNINVA